MDCPIAVVLISRETRPLLDVSLASLTQEQTLGFELIVVEGGFAANANLALTQCSAPLIAFLTPGDRIEPGRICGAVQTFQSQPELRQLHCGWQLRDRHGTLLAVEQPWLQHPSFGWSSLMQQRLVVPSCWTVRRQAVLEAGGFRPEQDNLAPLDLALRLAGPAGTSAWQPQVLVRHTPALQPPWRHQLRQLQELLEPNWQRLPASHQAWAAETRLDLALEGVALAWAAGDTPGAIDQLSKVPNWSAMPLARRAPHLLEHLHRRYCRGGLKWDRQAVMETPAWRQSVQLLHRP